MGTGLRLLFIVTLATTGCASVAPLENPVLVKSAPSTCENPVLVAPGQPDPANYAEVYECVIDILDDYFEIKPTSRYAGHIETKPRIAPGYEQPWKHSSPDARERLIATFQTIRQSAVVDIWAGDRGGYRVAIEVRRELMDIPRPILARSGSAVFQESSTVDRRAELVGNSSTADSTWIPAGRDYAFEQMLLKRIQECGLCKK
ncbi:hypothetical protein BH11PLA2_BH11PLA2_10440 [soil metagenome]